MIENFEFLPVCRRDMEARGWDRPDFVYVTGDAYVDHPSFGVSIIYLKITKEKMLTFFDGFFTAGEQENGGENEKYG
jgi:hypothetical protein